MRSRRSFSSPGAAEAWRSTRATQGGGNGASLSSGTAGDGTGASCPLWASKESLEHYEFVDFHAAGSPATMATPIPSACTLAPLTPQQKALEPIFFDLQACPPLEPATKFEP